ncbi:hypothetical protein Ahy_B06g084489 isoform D [Arachis hypogaea]|uniref:Histone-lysine N-methyltransferase n=1 Tax=Arachis hypogaea TaxID=3818 RepID=A0A444YS26_ARAHY|nr:hypothetical protein Ahy_B06g084489 isoform D [Arachis hypogaea]
MTASFPMLLPLSFASAYTVHLASGLLPLFDSTASDKVRLCCNFRVFVFSSNVRLCVCFAAICRFLYPSLSLPCLESVFDLLFFVTDFDSGSVMLLLLVVVGEMVVKFKISALLCQVIKYWAEKGISGFTVYKFQLKRIEGQPLMTTNQYGLRYLILIVLLSSSGSFYWCVMEVDLLKVYFTRGRVPQSTAEIRGLVCEDITGGQENIPIPATNLVDDPPVAPTGKSRSIFIFCHAYLYLSFTYCNSVKVAKNVKFPKAATGCKCKGVCIDSTTCECALRNGSEFPYVAQNGGRLVEAKDVVFECGPNCGCDETCVNRTSQKGIRYRLEVFRTAKKGWAVRSWDFIPAGAPVCEYTGILARTEDMDSVLENNYIFEIDCLQTIKGLGGRERRSQSGTFPSNLLDKYDDHGSDGAPEYCIDAGPTGNIARFINHCCEPNLFVQCVLSTHHNLKFARVVLFAADNIPPLQELTYDYGYELDSVLGPDGKVKQVTCYCGAPGCRKRLF